MHAARFLIPSLVGIAFFAFPVRAAGSFTVPFDIVVRELVGTFPNAIGLGALATILAGTAATVRALASPAPDATHAPFRTSLPNAIVRVVGAFLALAYVSGGAAALGLDESVSGLMWNTLALSIAVIVPFGGGLIGLLIHYGAVEFVGTIMQPVMRPWFRLPGRAALDSLTSWVGSYSVGLYLTRRMMSEGYYHRREAYTIATCFSTVSIGFVAIVARTLDVLHLFPWVFATYWVAVYGLTAVLVRLPPISRVAESYVTERRPRRVVDGASRLASAWSAAVARASEAPPATRVLIDGARDGVRLSATLLPSVLAVGTFALIVAHRTPLFDWLGAPLVPVLEWLRLPDASRIAPACLAGISEMYVPALLARDAALPARFFVAVLSISQLVFFSSLAPMILDMFPDVPVRAWELVWLFAVRTAFLIPFVAAVTHALGWAGILAPPI